MIRSLAFLVDCFCEDNFTPLEFWSRLVFISGKVMATFFVAQEDCWDLALRLRVDETCSSSKIRMSEVLPVVSLSLSAICVFSGV